MKKIVFGLFVTLCALIISPQNSRAEESVLDQSCTAGGGLNMLGQSEYQTFTPSKNRITRIDAYLSIEGLVPQSVNIQLYHGANLLLNTAQQAPSGSDWVTFNFSAIEMTPGDSNYRFYIVTSGVSDWFQPIGNPYSGGSAYESGLPLSDADFNFRTYGYDYTAPSTGNDTGTTVDSTTGGTTGSSPSTTTSSSIVKPSGLKAEYVAESKAVKLTWTKSTSTDIDGYRIYRSEEKTKGFTKAGQVDKSKLEYTDTTVAGEKTYYYYVRAYKGSAESASSDTITVVTPKIDAAVTTAVKDDSKTVTSKNSSPTLADVLKLYWFPIVLLGFGAIAMIVSLIVKVILPRIRAKKT